MTNRAVPGPFAEATGVAPTGVGGEFTAEIAEGWDIVGNANGGYLLAIAARALSATTGRPDPVSITAHYLAPGRPGPLRIETATIKQGRRFTTAVATLFAGDRPVVTALGAIGELTDSGPAQLIDSAPPDLPPVEQCEQGTIGDPFRPAFMNQIDLRLHPEDSGFMTGAPSGSARMRGWFRLRDGEEMDPITLTCAVDAFPPTIFNTNLPVAWTPTVELTVHVRARPAPGWLACSFSTRFITGGFLEADSEVWDVTGALVAQSRQLALVPLDPPPPST